MFTVPMNCHVCGREVRGRRPRLYPFHGRTLMTESPKNLGWLVPFRHKFEGEWCSGSKDKVLVEYPPITHNLTRPFFYRRQGFRYENPFQWIRGQQDIRYSINSLRDNDDDLRVWF